MYEGIFKTLSARVRTAVPPYPIHIHSNTREATPEVILIFLPVFPSMHCYSLPVCVRVRVCVCQCELAVDTVHKRPEGEAGPPVALPRREEITDTMIFPPGDLVTMTCRDVDLNFATRGTRACVRVCAHTQARAQPRAKSYMHEHRDKYTWDNSSG